MLDTEPKFWHNLPDMLDMLAVTWIFSGLGPHVNKANLAYLNLTLNQ